MKPIKKWWGFRHIRYYWLLYQYNRWAEMWIRMGIGLCAHPSDEAYLKAVWSGEE